MPMTRLLRFFKSPYPFYLNDERKNMVLAVGVSLFLIAFMTTFHPGHFQQLPKIMLTSAFTFIVLFPSIIVLPRLLPKVFDTVSWTFWKHIAFTCLQLLIIGVVISAGLYYLGYYPHLTFLETLIHIYPSV